jgi:hypothetical protein
MERPNHFAQAIDDFLSEIRDKEDHKSDFYKEVLTQASLSLANDDFSKDGKNRAEEGLSSFVQNLDTRYRKEQKTLKVMEKLRPLVDGLSQFTSAYDVLVQAGPTPLIILYGSARFVLQVSPKFSSSFEYENGS